MNCKHVTLLVLDLSTAVDTVDGIILFARLKSSIGINRTALNWSSYLNNRSHLKVLGFLMAFYKYRVWGRCYLPLTLANSLKSSNTIYG